VRDSIYDLVVLALFFFLFFARLYCGREVGINIFSALLFFIFRASQDI